MTCRVGKPLIMPFDWKQLLSDWRTPYPDQKPGPSSENEFRTHFESDYDRVVYSQPFRRLARKTQVHPVAPNDQVHNRLTHSIEVASVGRSFARRLAHFLTHRNEMPVGRTGDDLGWILMASCVAHDIGNPPFGHAGEFAIREWAASHPDEIFPPGIPVSEGARQDVLIFEGNAQGFRIAARHDNEHLGHLRLTYATLGAMVKYPWTSTDPRAGEQQKYNCFSTEADLFSDVFETMGLWVNGRFARHPLSFLSEAADDICYRVLDLEDAAGLGIITADHVRHVFCSFLDARHVHMPLAMMRSKVIQRLILESWQVFADDYDAIMTGGRTADLKSSFPTQLQDGLAQVNSMYQMIFAETSKVTAELGAFRVLGRILKTLCHAARELYEVRDPSQMMFVSRRCMELAWNHAYLDQHVDATYEWWLHQVLDYVSGLTDNFARQLSRDIEGT